MTEISVVVPTYNQSERLELVLGSFAEHARESSWEIIVVDDGSTDGTPEVLQAFQERLPLHSLRQTNRGRAAARNAGAARASGHTLVFCDGDRAIARGFLEAHRKAQAATGGAVVFGEIREVYVSAVAECRESLRAAIAAGPDPTFVARSRRPAYVARIMHLVGPSGVVTSPAAWLCCLTGNLSVPREAFVSVGGFDESFREWGFEHFELGYRLQRAGLGFFYTPDAANYHFAHRREPGAYQRGIAASVEILRAKHPHLPSEEIAAFAQGQSPIGALETALRRRAVGTHHA